MLSKISVAALVAAASAQVDTNVDYKFWCHAWCEQTTLVVPRYATCTITDPSGTYGTTGTVEFLQSQTTVSWVNKNDGGPCWLGDYCPSYTDIGQTNVKANVQNLAEGLHGFHVHSYGTLDTGCGGAGGHFNPTGVNHAAWDAPVRHVGDLQQLFVAEHTTSATLDYDDPLAGLWTGDSIAGRAIVIHLGEDDLGLGGDPSCSLQNGCAGPRVGCGIITPAAAPTDFASPYFVAN